jgi:SAM-dependent methyltransferase
MFGGQGPAARETTTLTRIPENARPDGVTAQVGRHYRGDAGSSYFEWQDKAGMIGGKLNAAKFGAHIKPDDTVVDFGSGAGWLLERLSCAERVGVDPNTHARASATARGLRMVPSAADLPAGFADVVISNHALEHTLRPYDELVELHRALKPGGRLVCWIPLDDWRTQKRIDLADTNHHIYSWTPLLLHNLLVEAGFDVLEIRVITHAWPPKVNLLMRLPAPVFDALAWTWSVLRRRRQLAAVAIRP